MAGAGPARPREARLFPLAQFMVDVYAAALLLEQAGWEHEHAGSDRKALVARLYVRAHLAEQGPFRGHRRTGRGAASVQGLVDGAFVDDRALTD